MATTPQPPPLRHSWPNIEHIVRELLYRDFWAAPPGPPLTTTFQELDFGPTDLHLLQFELQMIFGIAITHENGVQLTNSVGELLALVCQRLAEMPASQGFK